MSLSEQTLLPPCASALEPGEAGFHVIGVFEEGSDRFARLEADPGLGPVAERRDREDVVGGGSTPGRPGKVALAGCEEDHLAHGPAWAAVV